MKRLALAAALLCPAWAQAVPLEVTVSGVRNARGEVLVAICSQADFLKESCPYKGRAAAKPGAVLVRIDVPAGVYAAQAFHDEDGDGKLGRTALGLPKEGLGFSNNARMWFGPPSFADAAFNVGPQGGSIGFALRYYD